MEKNDFKYMAQKAIKLAEYKELKLVQNEKIKSISNVLDEVNLMLFNELKRLEELDTSRKDLSETEINRGNSMSNTSKTLLQTIAAQIAISKQIDM